MTGDAHLGPNFEKATAGAVTGQGSSSTDACVGSEKPHKEKRHKQIFRGIVPGFSEGFVYVFFSPIRRDPPNTHTHTHTHTHTRTDFCLHPVPRQSRKFVYVYVFWEALNVHFANVHFWF